MSRHGLSYSFVFLMAVQFTRPTAYAEDRLDLATCIRQALKNNPEQAAWGRAAASSKAQIKEAKSYFFPKLTLNASANQLDADRVAKFNVPEDLKNTLANSAAYFKLQDDINKGNYSAYSIPPGTNPNVLINAKPDIWNTYVSGANATVPNTFEAGMMGDRNLIAQASLEQPLYAQGKIAGRYKQAKIEWEAAESRARESELALVANVTQAYYGVVFGQELTLLGEETQTRFEVLRDLTERLYTKGSGKTTKLDFITVKVYLAEIRRQLEEARGGLESAKASLRREIGLTWNAPIAVADEHLPTTPTLPTPDTSVQTALRNNPLCRQAEAARRSAEIECSLARQSYWPTLGLSGDYTRIEQNEDFLNPRPNQSRVSLVAALPIFEGFKSSAQIRKTKESLAESRARETQAHDAVAWQVNTALIDLKKVMEERRILSDALSDAELRRDLADKSYEVDLIRTEDAVDAHVMEARAKEMLFRALFEENVGRARLSQWMGELN